LRCIIIAADFGTAIFEQDYYNQWVSKKYKNIPVHIKPIGTYRTHRKLHFEGVMLFFYMGHLFIARKTSGKLAAVAIALSIGN
jgi:hypothetical protein